MTKVAIKNENITSFGGIKENKGVRSILLEPTPLFFTLLTRLLLTMN